MTRAWRPCSRPGRASRARRPWRWSPRPCSPAPWCGGDLGRAARRPRARLGGCTRDPRSGTETLAGGQLRRTWLFMSRGHARATRQLRNRRGCAPGAKHLRATGRDEQRRAGTQAQGLRRGRGVPTHGGLRQHRRLSVRRERAHGPGLAAVGRPRLPAPPGRRRRTAGDQPDGRIERSRHIDPDARSAPTPQRAAAPQPRRAPAPPQHADRQQPRSSQRASRGPSPNATASPPVGGAGTGGTAPVRACSVAISAPGSAGAESGARAGADRAAAGSAAAPGVAQFPARVHVTPGGC